MPVSYRSGSSQRTISKLKRTMRACFSTCCSNPVISSGISSLRLVHSAYIRIYASACRRAGRLALVRSSALTRALIVGPGLPRALDLEL